MVVEASLNRALGIQSRAGGRASPLRAEEGVVGECFGANDVVERSWVRHVEGIAVRARALKTADELRSRTSQGERVGRIIDEVSKVASKVGVGEFGLSVHVELLHLDGEFGAFLFAEEISKESHDEEQGDACNANPHKKTR